ncbi:MULTISPECIES: polysaccharide biosynthesis protein [Staphylococcus]|uniref:polysaccharide biosynthesis protein n=1 Tax=Staphylococcus TaxID=1279 RepID=UPI000CD2595C|nr:MULTISPECIES: polysaccharide biosynthesis protein [Staphylococcus]POA02152.1 polysaccharide biosynthesis protein [Staphylococcus caprae]SUL96488.1 low temperature requirement B protein [Staphylococcus caprae]HCG75041.1 polysaccharide biosynthesis protein [Staphylococcus sp.]
MKRKSQPKTAFNGVIILTLALIIVKVLSAIYRVPYQNVLGDQGLYAYQQVYPIVALGMILSMNAIPSAVTQVLGVNSSISTYSKVMLRLQYVGFAIFVVIFICAHPIAVWMGDDRLTPMLRMASFSFIFIGILGVLRGFYQTKQEMNIPAISQVIEQFIRVGLIIIAIVLFSLHGWSVYQAGILAILASSIGFLGSMLYLVLTRPFSLKLKHSTVHVNWRQLFVSILIYALSQLIVILWQVVDSFTVIHTLQVSGLSFKEAIQHKGIYDRGASFIQMGLIVTTTFSFVLIPLLTEAIQHRNDIHKNRYANASVKITVLMSSAAGIGLINLLPLMNRVFFKNNALTATLSVYMVTVMCVSLIMMNIALLQVLNHIRPILIGITLGLMSKAILNVICISQFGILGASLSTVLSLFIFVGVLQIEVLKYYRFSQMRSFIIKLVGGMVVMSVAVQAVMFLIPSHGRMMGLIELFIGAFVGIGILIIYIMMFDVLSYKELKYLPFGDKLYHFKKGRRS